MNDIDLVCYEQHHPFDITQQCGLSLHSSHTSVNRHIVLDSLPHVLGW